jgi:peroxiredoxin
MREPHHMPASPSCAGVEPTPQRADPRGRADRRSWHRRGFNGALAALACAAAAGACTRVERAPDFRYTLLDGTSGEGRRLAGRVVLVSFWATTCGSCLTGMPRMVDLHREFHPRGFELLAVAMKHDPPARVAAYAEAHRLPFGVVIDNTGEVGRAFGDVRVTPSGFLIDRQRLVTERWTGSPDFGRLRAQIEQLVGAA